MNRFLYFLTILLFLTSFVTPELRAESNLNYTGPQVAKVIVARAVIYADDILTIPLGYVPSGKYITVGTIRKTHNECVPLVVNGRLGFISTHDIQFEEEKIEEKNNKIGTLKEHDVDIVLIKPEEKLNLNNSILLHFGQFNAGTLFGDMVYNLEGDPRSWLTDLGMMFLHRQSNSKFFWGAGFEYAWLNVNQLYVKLFMVNPEFGFTLLKNPVFSLDLFGNLDFTSGTDFKINNSPYLGPTPFIYGPKFGARLMTIPTTKYRFYGEMSYRFYNVIGLNNIPRYGDTSLYPLVNVDGINRMRGIEYTLGVSLDL